MKRGFRNGRRGCGLTRARKSDYRLEPLENRVLLSALTIVQENQLPGTPSSTWGVSGSGDSTIQGFPTSISVNVGQAISFKVTDTTSALYHIDIYRMGYYQGNGARLVTSLASSQTVDVVQPNPITDSTTGLVDAGNWKVTATWNVPSDATSGIYFANIVREDTGGKSQMYFVVRNDTSHSDILFKADDATWEAYNQWGGNSFYTGNSVAGSQGNPSSGSENTPTNRAVYASYNRPLLNRGQSPGLGFNSQPLYAEYPMVRWMERNGYDVSYFTDVDTDLRGVQIKQHKVFASVGHDEYWSGNERANVQAARDAGVNLAFFSGNEMYWKTRYVNSTANTDGTDQSNRILVCYKETWANKPIDPLDPTVWTGTWRDPRFSPPADGGQPENALTGTISMVDQGANPVGTPLSVPGSDANLRFWRNTAIASLTAGQTATLGDFVLGYEWDEDLDNGFRPAGLIDLSSTTQNVTELLLDWGSNTGTGTATHSLTFYKASSGADVFSAGTVQWSWGLDGNHDGGISTPDVNIQQATVNVLADMGVQPGSLQSGLVAGSASTDTIAPVSTIVSPIAGGTVNSGTPVTITGTATDSGGGVVAGVEVSVDGGQTWHPAIGRTNWSYTWIPGAPGSVVIKTRAVDDSGNLQPPSAGTTVTVGAPTVPLTLFTGPATPAVPDANDSSSVELGVRFKADLNGFITGIRFYKGPTNTGTHLGDLWSSSGALLATATFSGESASGWQQVSFASPVAITAGTIYTASYHTSIGNYSYTPFYFAASGVNNGPLHAPLDLPGSGNGVYAYGSGSTFPSNSFNSNNYWVDLVFTNTVADTTPPTVTAETPAPGAGGIATSATVTGTFSESVQPSTISLTLSGPSGGVAGTLSYSDGTHTATFTPSTPLASAASYTAVISGAKDLAGNIMTAPVTWSFTTASVSSGPVSLWSSSVTPAVNDANDSGSVELGTKFYSDTSGFITGLRFYKGPTNTGTHQADLWTKGGQLLASATFSGESSSGWQQVNFASPVSIAAGVTYVASYHTNVGQYSYSGAYFASTGVDNTPLHAPSSGAAGGNGVYAYGAAGTFPSNTYNANNYWVDVLFSNAVADTTPPSVVAESPTPASTGVLTTAPETATFSESVQLSTITFTLAGPGGSVVGTLSYNDSNHTATLTPTAALNASTTYTATVSGAKDLAGNVMTAPVTWTFTTGSNAWTQSTVADFNAGTPSNTAVISENGGQVQLAQTLDDFAGNALGPAWTTTSWASAGGGPASVTVSNSILSIGGSQVVSGTVPVGTPIEANLSFAAAPYQHFGLATGLTAIAGNYWVLFSTMGTTNTLFARANINGTTQDISVGALPTGFHDYAIQPVGGGIQFYVDGALKTTITAAIPSGTAIRAVFSEYGGSPLPAMQVDWVRFGGFASSGTFISSVFNAGKAAAYASASWNAVVPTGTTVMVQLRTSSDGINWSSWQTVGNGTAISPTLSGQYLQYDVIFTTTDPSLTPILNDITINWS